jgi:hypothetical protein
MGLKNQRSVEQNNAGISCCRGGQGAGTGCTRRAFSGFVIAATVVVAEPGVPDRDKVAPHRHRRLVPVPVPVLARRRGHAEAEIAHYRQQQGGPQSDGQVVQPGGLWL